ncbi:hypothetical protein D9O36_19460 [Zobellia amurskyensis]|uniref:Uncharacterized protein n=1 Tax=Zobellia amurskyensis TaxID=248905 RepID=A0A7X2ZX54_9FLAO|nr:hypothetical protein [Zobellia amurskyensis]
MIKLTCRQETPLWRTYYCNKNKLLQILKPALVLDLVILLVRLLTML